jgi:hypothetical protein
MDFNLKIKFCWLITFCLFIFMFMSSLLILQKSERNVLRGNKLETEEPSNFVVLFCVTPPLTQFPVLIRNDKFPAYLHRRLSG